MTTDKAINNDIEKNIITIQELRSIHCYSNLNEDEIHKLIEGLKELTLLLNMISPGQKQKEKF